MRGDTDTHVVELIHDAAHPLRGGAGAYDPLMERIGDARVVLLGEATHGTHEFYRERARITRRLVQEKGFNVVAVEADWPDAYRVNRFVQGIGRDVQAVEALGDFQRFPRWMWRNAEVLELIGWLREHNEHRRPKERAGFYGIDLYSLHASMEAVVGYLDRVDPEAAERARERYACFEHFGEEPQQYGRAAAFGMGDTCEREVLQQLLELRSRSAEGVRKGGMLAEDERFFAEQNARVALSAEAYYRTMFEGRVSSWNLRDTHMVDTLDGLLDHVARSRGVAKAVVWAHNSHLGDARATEMGWMGELNVGQLVRERYGADAVNVGFTTYTGTVSAASAWGGWVERKQVRPSLPGSYEHLLHQADLPRFMLDLRPGSEVAEALRKPRLERAIGVLYLPRSERQSHYFRANLTEQFDVVLHFDETRAVEPLERTSRWERGELPDTYPSAL